MSNSILIIDDKEKLCQSLAQNFKQLRYNVFYALNSESAIEIFSKNEINVVLLDVLLGQESGIDVLLKLQTINKSVPVIMITGYASIDSAVTSMKIGAFDYVKKPLIFENLLKIVENGIKIYTLSQENKLLKNRVLELTPQFITKNKTLIDLYKRAEKLAFTDFPILICGENGTGKEIIADYIHAKSRRSSYAMQKINCASFPDNLLDNELFGHEKGAYTGADIEFKGIFERAHNSTLFMDEIGDMGLPIQAKILRALQNNEIRRLGGNNTIQINVRFIAATNKNLSSLISAGLFREDLFYRLNTGILYLPPLRERTEDIPLLIEYFIKSCSIAEKQPIKEISEKAMEKLILYNWPGNIRELKNVINYAFTLSSKDMIEFEDLPPSIISTSQIKSNSISENIREENEKTIILNILKSTNNNKKKASEILKMSRKTLYNKIEKYGISV